MDALTDLFGETISTYTRQQAIDDGVLVQLSGPGYQGDSWIPDMVAEAGFRLPVAMTSAAFHRYVELSPAAERAGNDIKGRLWDVLWMLLQEIRNSRNNSELRFSFYCVTQSVRATRCELKALCGPGDAGDPVLTILLPEED